MSSQIQLRARAEIERRRRGGSEGAYSTFQTTYFDDWVALVHDCIDWPEGQGPTAYQCQIIADLQENRREAVRGPHGLGKTAIAAWCILAFALTRDGQEGRDWKVPTTASKWRQLDKFLWPEVHKWARMLRWDVIGREPFDPRRELQVRTLKLTTGEAFAIASDQPDAMEGAHADDMLYVYDESKTIPGDTWDAVEGAFAGAGPDTAQEAHALAISTPGPPQGRFYDIHSRKPGYEDWDACHITVEDAIAAGRVSRHWVEQRKKQWGQESAVYQNRVLGEFAASGEDTVISLALVEAANELWLTWRDAGFKGQFRCVGVDVGGGGDPSMLALRFDVIPMILVDQGPDRPAREVQIGSGIREIRRKTNPDPMNLTGITKGILDKHGGYSVIDAIGIGSGVTYRLREQGKTAEAFIAGASSNKTDVSGELGFVDCRSAAWWVLRELLERKLIALPPDKEIDPDGFVNLTGELTAPRWETRSGGKIKVESKKELRKASRLGHSTDAADAVIQAYWLPEGDEVTTVVSYTPFPIGARYGRCRSPT